MNPFLPIYKSNRERFLSSLDGAAALIFSSPMVTRSNDTEYAYRPDSDMLYLSGWAEPDAALLLRPGSEEPFILFVQPRDKTREIWTGRRPGPEGAIEEYGADGAYLIDELGKRLPALLQGYETLHHQFAISSRQDQLVMKAVASARRMAARNGMVAPVQFVDFGVLLHQQRLIKSEAEITVMRQAAEITREAHVEAMKMTAPGVHEYELEAKISYVFRSRGGSGPGYTSIVGGGDNAVILHYINNDQPLLDGDLVCVDAGCEYGWYTADVTRTWPVNGCFSPPQRELYEAVLCAQLASIEAAQSGALFDEVHLATVRSITQSLVELGFLEGDLEELIARDKFRKWFMHGTSHWLGIDVHDTGRRAEEGESTLLRPGMVLTIEPGLYVASDDEEAPERFRGMGIRIEDDILIGEEGPINLTEEIPKTVEEIEELMASAQ
jgi:Xaa-Pro aminopeptidase